MLQVTVILMVNDNHFSGYQAGYKNTSGNENLFIGNNAGYNNTTGYDNQFVGLMQAIIIPPVTTIISAAITPAIAISREVLIILLGSGLATATQQVITI